MSTEKKKRKKGIVDALLLAVCIVFGIGGCLLVGETVRESSTYSALEEASVNEDGGIDWAALRARNPDIAAWVSVDGTGISLPVMNTRKGDSEGFYLSHDFDRNYSFVGCPYLDARSSANGAHALVYGHNMGFANQAFSPIYKTYVQGEFDKIGDLVWSTPEMGTVRFKPVLAMSVDKRYQTIQRFAYSGVGDLREWLGELKHDATAVSSDADKAIANATRVVTLVTCSTLQSGGRTRTLLVFAA